MVGVVGSSPIAPTNRAYQSRLPISPTSFSYQTGPVTRLQQGEQGEQGLAQKIRQMPTDFQFDLKASRKI